MHLINNDNEINSSVKGSEILNETQIIENQSVYGSQSVSGTQTIGKTSTSSTDSCCSSTDSGVIITDDTRTYNNNTNNKSNNYKTIPTNDNNASSHNANNNNHNSTSSNTSCDISNNNNNMDSANNDDKRRRYNEDNLRSNTNCSINNQIDKNNINIENVINVGGGNGVRHKRHSTSRRTSSPRNCSPAVSIRSNTISIMSIDENAIDSSVVDSDSDYEGQHSDYIVKKLGQQTTYEPDHPNLLNINKGMQVLSQTISPGSLPPTAVPLNETLLNRATAPTTLVPPMSPNAAQIGSIALTNSTDVTFGDKHFYEGPVTIQQIVIDSRDKRKNGSDAGKDNPAYSSDGSDPENSTKPKYEAEQPQGLLKFIFNRRAIIISALIIIITILAGIIIVTTSTHTKQPFRKSKVIGDGDDSRKHIPINSTIEPDSGYKFNGSLLIVSRDEWLAMAEREGVEELKLPVPRVIIAHTASTTCDNKIQCDFRVQSAQAFHMQSQNWGDIGYNFLVGGNGLVYEGRGWKKVGAHTKGYNRDSICIAFIGTFNEELPTENDLKAAQLLIEEGVKLGVIAENYKLYGARQLSGTESPGKALYSIIMKWSHWTDDNVGGGMILRIVPRDAWLAQPPSAAPIPLATPVERVIVLSTLTDVCDTQAMCVYRVRMTQTLNIESQKYDDIIYNFLIGGDGNVYEGRGWDITGAHLRGHNSNSISFAYIGTFKRQKPSDKQMNVTKLLLEEGVRLRKLTPDYKIYGAYMLDPTSSDVKGDELYKSFKNWPHWTE